MYIQVNSSQNLSNMFLFYMFAFLAPFQKAKEEIPFFRIFQSGERVADDA